jgi:hypothetical protein
MKNEHPINNSKNRMSQDTGLSRDCKDQFYTRKEVASLCVDVLRKHVPPKLRWIEPSAGRGVFLEIVPDATGYDIDPKHPVIQKADFLDTDIPKGCVVFGNPPFGRQSSLAKQFIRHAADKADWIGFILPRSFVKPSMQHAFPVSFHLVETVELPKDSFVVNDVAYDVPCVFQVWARKTDPRELPTSLVPNGFAFVKKTDTYSLAFRRVGINAGKCCLPSPSLSVQSHYFVRLDDTTKTNQVIQSSQTHVFPTNTTGPRSLSKNEAIEFLQSVITNTSAGDNIRSNSNAT